MTLSVHRRLLTVAVLAFIACAGALFTIVHLWHSSTEQRLERARETVLAEVERLREADPGAAVAQRPAWQRGRRMHGVEGGYLDAGLSGVGRGPLHLPEGVVAVLGEAARKSQGTDEVVMREVALQRGTLVLGVAAVRAGGYAWAAARVLTSRELDVWRAGVLVLALASLGLVLASLQAMVVYQRDATSLQESLQALGRDLRAPVVRPAVRELRQVADGIAALAGGLALAQEEQTRLHRVLAERERLASLGRITAGLAHEVRNPLTAIKLRVDLAQVAPDTPVALSHDLADISAEVGRLDRLMTDLLTVAGRRTGPRSETDLGELVRRRVDLLLPWAGERGVAVQVRGAAKAAVAPDAVARAMDNLVRNAVEASPPGEVVRIELGAGGDGKAVSVVVSDRGQGVSAERQAELFEPFFTTKPEGTGLGLALSRAVALAHGGSLTYQREGETTRFVLVLPLEAGGA